MDEISSFVGNHQIQDPPTYDWWVGAIPPGVGGQRPTTWHYVPVLCYNGDPNQLHVWKKLTADWYEHFPEPGPIPDQFVRYFDVRHVQQWRTYWVPNDPTLSSAYSIFVQFDDNDKPFGRAIHFGPTPSQVNKVTLGAVWNQNQPQNPGDPAFGDAIGGVQVEGTGRVIFGGFAILGPGYGGTFVIPNGQQEVVNGKTYWKVKVGASDYGIEMTEWPPAPPPP